MERVTYRMAKPILMTEEGLTNIENELDILKSVKRKEVAEKIKVALSFGDLSENSEYDEAKNDQAMVEARIAEIEVMLKNVQIIDETTLSSEIIRVGSTVKLLDEDFDEEVTYRIVGSNESDPANQKISDESPLGRALIDHGTGERIEVEAPAGVSYYTVLEIVR